ncbi:MAG: ATP-binding cassette domain-containing protein [Clostridia bacterium]|nr:ATP-binding cassette domain-containing protein [Clostridia bacterium]
MFLLKEVKYKNILNIKALTIPENKVTCILGESGSGKSTLLRLLNKLISYDRGEIFYNNQSLKEIDSVKLRRSVVMLPQSPAIFSGNIRDNLLIGLKFAEKPPVSDDRLHAVLKLVHLDEDLNKDAEKLSEGEKQRLTLGRVLLLDPHVFLLDEPSSSLDEDTEHIIISSLVDYVKKNNKTLIMVTHSKKVANHFADNTFEIKKATIINEGEV